MNRLFRGIDGRVAGNGLTECLGYLRPLFAEEL